jgi:hypothetical protein
LWNYEVGSKNRLFNGGLVLDASVYHVKWSNIQQSVRLPICSNSFIGNLGNATSNGFDLAVTVAPVRGIQIGGSVGYNKTNYDDDVFGGAGILLRAEGDRIGGPKWTGSVFGEVNQEVGKSRSAYLRADYTFASRGIDPTPGTFGYDAGLPGLPGTDYATLRAGLRTSGVDVSVFVNNLTNSSDLLSRSHDSIGSPLYYGESYRPRTIGLTLQYRR